MNYRALGGSVAAAGFVGFMAVAIALYPVDAAGHGYDFFGHYWCDLFDPASDAGFANPGQWWAVLAMVAAALGLGTVFWSLRGEARGGVSALGLLGAAGVVAVPVVTALGLLDLHRLLILVTGPPGLLGLILAIAFQARREALVAARAGYVLLALGGWNFIQYTRQAVLGSSRWAGLPAVQKAATAALLLWLLCSLWLPGRRDVGK